MALRFAKGGKTPAGLNTMGQIRYGLGFGQSAADDQPQRYKGENLTYRVSGITILSCVILAALSNLLPASVNAHWPLLFIFEAFAVFAFGFSWFVKGRTMEGIRTRIPWKVRPQRDLCRPPGKWKITVPEPRVLSRGKQPER
jgi:hypothetical protein